MGRLSEDIYVDGTLQAKTLIPSATCIDNSHVKTNAAIAASKLVNRFRKIVSQNGTAVTGTFNLHLAIAAGVVNSLKMSVLTACIGGATLTVDLQKYTGGAWASILTGATPCSLTAAAANSITTASLAATSFIASDMLRVVITATVGGGTLATGLVCDLEVDENPL